MKMKSLSGVGLGLSLVFGCLLLALIAELYYLLWWKKRPIAKTTNIEEDVSHIQPQTTYFPTILFCCWNKNKNPAGKFTLRSTVQELCSSSTLVHEPQSSSFSNKNSCEITGLPRFLFTIAEETVEDLESDDGVRRKSKQSTSRSNLSDLLQLLETPFLTPIGSPPYYTPPLTPSFASYNGDHPQIRFSEPEKDAAFNRMRSSPPPKFKFLRDAEEKLILRSKIMEEENGASKNEEENGTFITLVIAESQEEEAGVDLEQRCFSSSTSSQVLPVDSSPATIKSTLQWQVHKPGA